VLGANNELITYIGCYDPSARSRPGWPNTVIDGRIEPPVVAAGVFNTPHGIAADTQGNLYVTEWLIGGRLAKLTRHK
jgi:hypothetical protein